MLVFRRVHAFSTIVYLRTCDTVCYRNVPPRFLAGEKLNEYCEQQFTVRAWHARTGEGRERKGWVEARGSDCGP
jgi:hypothetical protein